MQHGDYAGVPDGASAIPLKARGGGVRAWAVVDEADYAWASQFNWSLSPSGYAIRNVSHHETGGKNVRVMMHREMLGLGNGRTDKRECDHINRNRLDNRRSNLRVVTHKENGQNQGCNKRTNRSSKYRGVSWHKATQKWWAYARIDGVLKSAGYYHDEEEAAAAASALRAKHWPLSEDAA